MHFSVDMEGDLPGELQIHWPPLFPCVWLPKCQHMQLDVTVRSHVWTIRNSCEKIFMTSLIFVSQNVPISGLVQVGDNNDDDDSCIVIDDSDEDSCIVIVEDDDHDDASDVVEDNDDDHHQWFWLHRGRRTLGNVKFARQSSHPVARFPSSSLSRVDEFSWIYSHCTLCKLEIFVSLSIWKHLFQQ